MIVGLMTLIEWTQGNVTPLVLDKLVVLLILTDGRGGGSGRIVCYQEETGDPVFGSGDHPISFAGKDPSLPYGVTFELLNCRFPSPGAYDVQFRFDGEVLARQTVIVR